MALHNVPQLAHLEPEADSENGRKPQLVDPAKKDGQKTRKRALVLTLALLVVTLFVFSEYKERASLKEASAQSTHLRQQVHFEDVSLSNVSGWSRISGRVHNSSAYMLTGADLTITIQDCVQNSCETVGQNSLTVNDLSVPAQQSRAFERYITFKGLPPPRGQYQWHYSIEQLRGY